MKGHVADDEVQELADLFAHASDPTRIRILLMLLGGELCVCSIAEGLEVTVSAVSHQLRVLRSGGLVSRRKDGRHVHYRLSDSHIEELISIGLEHVRE